MTVEIVKVEKLLLSRAEAAKVIDCSLRWFDARVAQGEIPGLIRLAPTMPRWNYRTLQRWTDAGCPPLKEFQDSGLGAVQCNRDIVTPGSESPQLTKLKTGKANT